MLTTDVEKSNHGHHKISAAIFVASLILGSAMILSAELIKPERYEFHTSVIPNHYVIYDRDTGRATDAEFNSKTPTAALAN